MTPQRIMFWQIDHVWTFYVLAAMATGFFLAGLGAYMSVWKKSVKSPQLSFSGDALKKMTLDVLMGRRVLQGNVAAGLMHLFIFWGFVILFIGTSLLALHEYVHPYLKGKPYLFFEASMEVGGLILLAGLIWALVRRYLQRIPRLERRVEDALVPLWLLVVTLSGFFLEGVRLAAQKPPWAHWSFVGSMIAGFISDKAAGPAYPYLWWGHAPLSLGFIALIPFTKLFHIIGGPTTFYLHHSAGESGGTPPPAQEVVEAPDMGEAVFFDACMRCGRCAQVCPSTGAGEPFTPRDFVQAQRRLLWQEYSPVGDIQFLNQEQPIDSQAAWYCTTCAACLEVCPVYGAAFKVVSKKRTLLVEEGKEVPDLMNQTLERLFNYENPWVASKRDRAAWAKGLDVPVLTRGSDEKPLCYFVGCTTSYDARAQEIAKSFTALLKRAGVPFGILGDKEPCCGDIARVVGEVGLFQEKMENCLDLFDQYGIEEMVTSSPHCFHTFQNEYSGRRFGVRPYPLVLRELIAQGRLRLKNIGKLTVTYHDPCYLGRHNRIFEEPRGIIRSIPGVNLVEMPHHGADSLCCGGGGGRMWQGSELHGEARMSEIRIKEARATGAEVLITACPLCLIMLEDALKTLGLEGQLKVMDLNELVLQSLDKNNQK